MGRKFYNFVWTVMRSFYRVVYPQKVSGRENLPEEGGFVLCINHFSNHDPLYVSACIPRERAVHFLAKKQLFDNKFMRPIVTGLGAIPVDRGNADLAAVRSALRVVKDGNVLGIFPQGTRSLDNSPTPMLNGASMIALRAGVPVIPAYVDGPYRLFRRTAVRFGPAVDLSAFGRRCDSATLTEVTHQIESAIWGLRGAQNS